MAVPAPCKNFVGVVRTMLYLMLLPQQWKKKNCVIQLSLGFGKVGCFFFPVKIFK
jgi:hypothetical protein